MSVKTRNPESLLGVIGQATSQRSCILILSSIYSRLGTYPQTSKPYLPFVQIINPSRGRCLRCVYDGNSYKDDALQIVHVEDGIGVISHGIVEQTKHPHTPLAVA